MAVSLRLLGLVSVVLVVVLSLSLSSFAGQDIDDEKSFYIGIGGSYVISRIDPFEIHSQFVNFKLDYNNSLGVAGLLGKRFNDWISCEIDFRYIFPLKSSDRFENKYSVPSAETFDFNTTIISKLTILKAVPKIKLSYEINKFKPFVSLGAGFMSVENEVRGEPLTGAYEIGKDTENNFCFSGGIGFDINDRFFVAGEYSFSNGDLENIKYFEVVTGLRFYLF